MTLTDRIGIALLRTALARWWEIHSVSWPVPRHAFDLYCDCTICESIVQSTIQINIRILSYQIAAEIGLVEAQTSEGPGSAPHAEQGPP